MGEPSESNVPLGILGHRAETERLARLTDFLERFAPSPTVARQPGRSGDDSSTPAILAARERAVRRAFVAVGRIARMSFQQPSGEPS